jgi:choline dehydrogenase
MESFEGGANVYRGANGPLRVQRCKMENPLYGAFLSAGQAFGLKFNEDPNGGFQEGVHVAQATIHNGERQSTSVAFLHPVIGRANLTVETGVLVSGLRITGNRVEGVNYISGGRAVTATANEVVLSAGAYGTPQLLMLSGIGDPDHLEAVGVTTRVRLPGVGRNLQDHTAVPLRYTTNKALSPIRQFSSVGRLVTGARWVLSKGGGGRSNYFEVGAFFRGNDDVAYVNMQHEFCPMIAGFDHGGHDIRHGFQYFTSIMRPRSRGRIMLRSGDPKASPIIHLNLLGDPDDMAEIVAGVQRTREIIRQRPWQELGAADYGVTADEKSDSGLERWIRSAAGTGYHPVGTCRMGSDDMAVADGDGRVHGVEGLRIVDASLMPLIVTGNTNAAAIMIGEKLADRILGRRLPRAEAAYEGQSSLTSA